MRVYKVLRKDARGKRWSLLTGSHVENRVGAEATDFKIQYYVTKPSVLVRFKQNKRINKKWGWPEGTMMVKELQLKRKILRRNICV